MRKSFLPALRPAQLLATFGAVCALFLSGLRASTTDDAATVAALDTEFQAAVKRNDAGTIARIQAEDMILVTGRGAVFTRADHIKAAQDRERTYEVQDEVPGTQKVRVWGDTAVVTALLWIKGTVKDGKAFD